MATFELDLISFRCAMYAYFLERSNYTGNSDFAIILMFILFLIIIVARMVFETVIKKKR
jgi:hypothetical protein